MFIIFYKLFGDAPAVSLVFAALTAAAVLVPLLGCLALTLFPGFFGGAQLSRPAAEMLFALASRLLTVGACSALAADLSERRGRL